MGKTRIFFDGAYSSKTRDMYAGIVCENDHLYRHTGPNGSSADHSEWIAAVWSVEYAIERGFTDVELIGDSANVIGAMQGRRRTRDELKSLRGQVEHMCAESLRASWRWIGRDANPAGEMLEDLKARGELPARGLFG